MERNKKQQRRTPTGHHHPLHFDNRPSCSNPRSSPAHPKRSPRGWPHGGGQIYPKTAHPDRLKFGQPSKSHCRMKVFPVLCFLALLTELREWITGQGLVGIPNAAMVLRWSRVVSSPVSSVPPGQEQKRLLSGYPTPYIHYRLRTYHTTDYYYGTTDSKVTRD